MEETINIREYIGIFKKRKKIIIITMILFILLGGILTYRNKKMYTPTYSSIVSVKININKKEPIKSEDDSYEDDFMEYGGSLHNSTLNQSIAENYFSLATSKMAMMNLIDKLDLKTTPEVLSSQISVVPQESLKEFIDITVRNNDKKLAKKIASTMPEVFNEQIKRVIGLDCVEVLYDATPPMKNPKPQDNSFRNLTLIGIVISIFIVLLLECLDNKVVTPEDVEEYWGLPVIAAVPFDKENSKGKK